MKNRLYQLLTSKHSVLGVFIISLLLFLIEDDLDYFFGLAVLLFIAWNRKWNWKFVDFGRKISFKVIYQSIGIAILFFLISSVIDTFVEQYFGPIDLSFLDIENNTSNYIMIMIIMWVFAAFGEEMLYHGYYTKGLAVLMGNTKTAWIISISIVILFFSAGHLNQGLSGAIGVGLITIPFSYLFYKNQSNLMLLVLVHGFYDSISLTLLYLGKYYTYSNWLSNLFF